MKQFNINSVPTMKVVRYDGLEQVETYIELQGKHKFKVIKDYLQPFADQVMPTFEKEEEDPSFDFNKDNIVTNKATFEY